MAAPAKGINSVVTAPPTQNVGTAPHHCLSSLFPFPLLRVAGVGDGVDFRVGIAGVQSSENPRPATLGKKSTLSKRLGMLSKVGTIYIVWIVPLCNKDNWGQQ